MNSTLKSQLSQYNSEKLTKKQKAYIKKRLRDIRRIYEMVANKMVKAYYKKDVLSHKYYVKHERRLDFLGNSFRARLGIREADGCLAMSKSVNPCLLCQHYDRATDKLLCFTEDFQWVGFKRRKAA